MTTRERVGPAGWIELFQGPSGRLFGLLCLLNLLNYIDRQAVTGLLDPIRKELGATDAQMGLVGSAFLFTYTMLPPIFGFLGDRFMRTKLLASSAGIWCLATAASGLVRSVGQLAVARAFVGIGEASYMANTPGILSDMYPEARRGRVLSIFYAAAPLGAAAGVAAAGWIAGHLGWRAACFLVGLPGLIAAFMMYRAREPVRGAMESAPAAPPVPFFQAVREFLTRPPLVALTLGFAGHVFVQNAVEYWLPTILQRDKAIPIAEANATYGMMVFIAGIVGPVAGAIAGDWALRKTRWGYHIIAGIAIAGAALPLAVIAVATTKPVIFGGVLLEALFGNASAGLVMAVAMAQVGAERRSTTAAILLFSMHLLGDFISWPLVGSLSTAMAEGRLGGLVSTAAAFGVDPGSHLSIALVSVAVPVAGLAVLFYLLSAWLGSVGPRPQPAEGAGG